ATKVELLLRKGIELELKGSILVTPEGVNVMLAGTPDAVWEMHRYLGEVDAGLKEIDFKQSWSQSVPFRRYLVKEKSEVIKLGLPEIQPLHEKGAAITPENLKSWYDEKREFTILDTRNDYEVRIGTFQNAVDMRLKNFVDFPEKLKKLPAEAKKKPLVMFCTGGVRCERASLVAERQGFEEVYQLEGGILRYFEKVGGAHYEGDCFVFDYRVALTPELKESQAVLCFACGEPLSVEDQKSDHYEPLVSCPYCIERVSGSTTK
ncbi:MAG: rhodanese-like domain-containing protein, partial [Bdellovibrionota bacterium]